MIRPLPAPRFTGQARSVLAQLARAFGGVDPVLLVEVEGPEGVPPRAQLRFVSGAVPLGPGQVQREDVPVPVRFTVEAGVRLTNHVIDLDEEGGVQRFRVRAAGLQRRLTSSPPLILDDASQAKGTEVLANEISQRIHPLVERCGGIVRLVRLRADAVAEVFVQSGPGPDCLEEGSLLEVILRVFHRAFPLLQGVEPVSLTPGGGASPSLASPSPIHGPGGPPGTPWGSLA